MDWPATQGQQQHATSWPVEKIHHTWSFGSDATVLEGLRVDDDDDERKRVGLLYSQLLQTVPVGQP